MALALRVTKKEHPGSPARETVQRQARRTQEATSLRTPLAPQR